MYNKPVPNICQQQHTIIHELVAQCPTKINLMHHTWSKLTPIICPTDEHSTFLWNVCYN